MIKLKLGIIVKYTMIVLIAFLLLSAKNCEVNDKADILKLHPEFKGVADKFDVKKFDNLIRLTTYDNISFQEAINKLKKTAMNKPIAISFYENESIGEFEIEIAWKNIKNYGEVFHYYDGKQPYKGIIWLFDGWWDALEIDASSMFLNEKADADESILVKEFSYGNKTVMKLNNFDTKKPNYTSVASRLQPSSGSTSTIKGDKSTPDATFAEFDK
jgi:hypothetical protein